MTSYTITNNDYFKSIEISFTEKPSEDVRNILKALRFRWHYTKKVWYGYANKQVLIDRLNTIISDNSIKVDPVNAEIPAPKTEPVNIDNVQPVKVDLSEPVKVEAKTEKAVKTVNPFIKPKKEKVKREAGKLKASQENAIITLMKYNYFSGKKKLQKDGTRRIFVEKNGVAFIGNVNALVRINLDRLTDETKKQLESLKDECSTVTFEGTEKIYNGAVKIQENADPLTLENMVEKENEGFKLATFSTGLTFNYPLLKDICRCFDYKVTIKAEKIFKPALIEGEGFTAIICGMKVIGVNA